MALKKKKYIKYLMKNTKWLLSAKQSGNYKKVSLFFCLKSRNEHETTFCYTHIIDSNAYASVSNG